MAEPADFQTLHEIVQAARRNLAPEHWDYVIGGAETETTVKRNRQALDSLAFRPRVLRDVSDIDSGGELFGHKLRLPALLAPIGSMQDIVAGGGLVPARAAAEFGTIGILSSVCAPGLEAVAEATDAPKIYQLYVRGDPAWVDEQIRRAVDAGYVAFCLTVDLDAYSRRERDIAKRHVTTGRLQVTGDANQALFSWDDIERVRDLCDIPLILKGIATAEDAKLAVEHGIDAVYVSNHGGRQLDHGRGGIDVLPEVVEAVGDHAKIIFDGGIMRGTDLVKAMALGADAVGIGRLQGLAAGAAGEAGIVRALELLEAETRIALALLGVAGYGELDASYLHPAPPVAAPHVLSAFPLVDEGY
jgi:glycolate oxidase